MLKYFKTAPGEYAIPSDIERYVEHDDHYLMKVLRNSHNPYANAIVKNNIPAKIYESFNDQQLATLEKIQQCLSQENVDFIRCSSSGRLSKYYNQAQSQKQFKIKVVRTLAGQKNKNYFNIEEATDLFQKFSKSHAVNRLHCDIDQLPYALQIKILDLTRS